MPLAQLRSPSQRLAGDVFIPKNAKQHPSELFGRVVIDKVAGLTTFDHFGHGKIITTDHWYRCRKCFKDSDPVRLEP
jgi:hypothetical protein